MVKLKIADMVEPSKQAPAGKKDVSQAILEKKKAPNKLTVEESKNNDNTIIEMTEKRMEELGILRGDQVLLKGKKKRETICIAFIPEDADAKNHEIRMNKGTRRNLRVRLGDVVTVKPLTECPNAE